MPRVGADYPKTLFLVVDIETDEKVPGCRAGELGVAKQVFFAGYQGDTQPYFDEIMDIFAMASAHEAFYRVLVRIFCADMPVVAIRIGGVPDVVKDRDAGYLVEPYQPEVLAKRALSLANDPAVRVVMGRVAHRQAPGHCDLRRDVGDANALYRPLLPARNIA